MIKKKLKLFIIFPILGILFTNISYACTSAISPWYVLNIKIENPELYTGTIEPVVSNTGQTSYYLLSNDSEEPLYIVKPLDGKPWSEPNSGVPETVSPTYKMSSEGNYYWDIDSKTWEKYYSLKDGVILDGYRGLNRKSAVVMEGSVNTGIGDNRPDNVEIPKPHKFTLYTYQNGEVREINGTINYELNKDYSPTSIEDGRKICGSSYIPSLVTQIIVKYYWIVILLVGLAILLKKLNNK